MIIQEQNLTRNRILSELLSQHPDVEAAALYGSVARGDSEDYSDIDILVFCRTPHKLPIHNYLVEQLSYFGSRLSLAIYSEKELEFLNSAKSLFLLHLSKEAILLFDKTGYLQNLLLSFEPKDSYRDDFIKSKALVDPLSAVVAGSPNQLHRLSYAYSLFRVFGVYLLAERGVFEFSKDKMANQLASSFPSLSNEVQSLSRLRILNSNFFGGGPTRIPTPSSSHDLNLPAKIRAIASLIKKPISLRELKYQDAIEEFATAVDESKARLDYRLRMWFLLLVYDGLNLHLLRTGHRTLTNFAEVSLAEIESSQHPEAVRAAAGEAIEYLHRYPLKYFLAEELKISTKQARQVLLDLSAQAH